jgi:mannose-6-phosphate isomerase class I
MKVFPIEGAVQHYDWGGFSYIPALLHLENKRQQPFAELWMGTHPRGSATFLEHQQVKPLREYIARQPEVVLGVPTAQQFHNELPLQNIGRSQNAIHPNPSNKRTSRNRVSGRKRTWYHP